MNPRPTDQLPRLERAAILARCCGPVSRAARIERAIARYTFAREIVRLRALLAELSPDRYEDRALALELGGDIQALAHELSALGGAAS